MMWGEAGECPHLNPLPEGQKDTDRGSLGRSPTSNIHHRTCNSEARISIQKIDPIKGEKRDDEAADKFSLARGELRDSRARRPHDYHGQRIEVEDRQPTIEKECERVRFERGEKARVKKCHGRSRRTAGQTGVTRQRMKQTN